MKTIKHVTTVKTVEGKALPEAKKFETPLDVPETEADILALVKEKGFEKICEYITDSLKLECNGMVRQKHFPTNAATVRRDRTKVWLSDVDLVKFAQIMKQSAKQAAADLDKAYNEASDDEKKTIDAIEL